MKSEFITNQSSALKHFTPGELRFCNDKLSKRFLLCPSPPVSPSALPRHIPTASYTCVMLSQVCIVFPHMPPHTLIHSTICYSPSTPSPEWSLETITLSGEKVDGSPHPTTPCKLVPVSTSGRSPSTAPQRPPFTYSWTSKLSLRSASYSQTGSSPARGKNHNRRDQEWHRGSAA